MFKSSKFCQTPLPETEYCWCVKNYNVKEWTLYVQLPPWISLDILVILSPSSKDCLNRRCWCTISKPRHILTIWQCCTDVQQGGKLWSHRILLVPENLKKLHWKGNDHGNIFWGESRKSSNKLYLEWFERFTRKKHPIDLLLVDGTNQDDCSINLKCATHQIWYGWFPLWNTIQGLLSPVMASNFSQHQHFNIAQQLKTRCLCRIHWRFLGD